MIILTTPDGTEIYYETHVDLEGTPVVLIHVLGADHSTWDCQIRKYPEMGIVLSVTDVRWHDISAGADPSGLQSIFRRASKTT
ncbi:MAG: hypothetical protein U9N43_06280 [Euryarchaeota archaeon]|nr:hypothetical protein [Euryarchaeota archaeon]